MIIELTWRFCSCFCYGFLYAKNDEQIKSIERIELTSHWAINLINTKAETGIKEVNTCPSDSPSHYHFRNLISSKICILSFFVWGNKDFLDQMTLIVFNIYNQYQIIVRLFFNNTTNIYKNITKSNSDEQI